MKSRFAPLAIALSMCAPLAAWSQISLSINVGPPPLPVYEQPPIPGDGYIWTPGYWSWNPSEGDYYWVPGTWVLAPAVGYLWTPGYWGFEGRGFLWHAGYWADHVGFYGGIDYGYGYTGRGYYGGRWNGSVFSYNRSVNNINPAVVHHIYNTTVVNNYNTPRVSFNGGQGGVSAKPSSAELRVQTMRHIAETPNQVQHERVALATPAQRLATNHGAPQVAATPRPAMLNAPGVVHARNPGTTTTAAAPARTAAVARPGPAPAAPAAQRAPLPVQPPAQAQARAQPPAAPVARAVPPPPNRTPAAPQAAEQRVAHAPTQVVPRPPQAARPAAARPAVERPAAPPAEARPARPPQAMQPPEQHAVLSRPQPRAEAAPHAPQPQARAPAEPRAQPAQEPHAQPQKGREER